MFTKRNERELSEIKELASGLLKGIPEALEQLGRINELQQQRLAKRARGPASAGVDGNGAQPLIGFVHIPKTAGGTVTTMFSRAYSRAGVHAAGNYMTGPEQTARKVTKNPGGWERWHQQGGRVSVGHVPYRVFREHLPVDALYMTFLREPVDRVLSHYYRHIHAPDLSRSDRGRARERLRERAGSLEEALVDMRLPQISNLATRFLCGHPTRDGELAASALDSAKANLRNFAFVGIQERFDESLVVLQRMLGLDLVPYFNRHVSIEGGRPAVDEIPDEQRALIEEHNQLDLELYSYGLSLFEDAFARAEEAFAADAKTLRASSEAANAEELQTAREWLERELPPGTTRVGGELRAQARAAGVRIAALKIVLNQIEPGDQGGPGNPAALAE
jgi:sulfotransferase famil protein